jgi:hypothetical protein
VHYPRVTPTRSKPDLSDAGEYDYNPRELIQLQRMDDQKQLKAIPYATGPRCPPKSADYGCLREFVRDKFSAVTHTQQSEHLTEVDPSDWLIDYRRAFSAANYKEAKTRIAYGLSKKGTLRQKAFIIIDG